MYCKRCLAALPEPPEDPTPANDPWLSGKSQTISYASPHRRPSRCRWCFRKYDPDDPRTYLATLALTRWQIVRKIILTTLVGIGAAYVVAFHQMAATSGH
jgi:hypothetical protein